MPKIFFLLLCIAEGFLLTSNIDKADVYLSPVLILLTGIGIGLCVIYKSFDNGQQTTEIGQRQSKIENLFSIGIFIYGFIQIKNQLTDVFKIYAIDKSISDIIPQIQIILHYFLSGKTPYVTFNDLGYPMFPCYLPAQWLPFVLAEKYQFDYRWISSSVLCIGIAVLCSIMWQSRLKFYEKAGVVFFIFFFLSRFITLQDVVFGATIETLMSGYYILLAVGIYRTKNLPLRAGLITLCLLSRFSFLFWVPLYIGIVALSESYRNAFKLSLYIFLGVFLFYILPFMIIPNDYTIFFKTQQYYTEATVGEWQHLSDNGEVPRHLFNGKGLACYFYMYVKGDLLHKIHIAQFAAWCANFLAAATLFFFFLKKKNETNARIYAVGALKIIITVFYAFVQIPYSYLFLVPLGLTQVMLFVFNGNYLQHSEKN